MRLHYLQHVPFEGPGCIVDWASMNGHTLGGTRLFAGDELPTLADIDWLFVMGGPMNIYEEDIYPWLVREKTFIQAALDADKTILGICLGAQLIADVLGGPVSRSPEGEIGWFPLTLTEVAISNPLLASLPSTFDVLHWHGDTFALPVGSTLLASSAACVNQAFLYGTHVLGFQFHLEMRLEDARNLIANCGDEIGEGPYMQPAEKILADTACFQQVNQYMFAILNQLAGS